MPLSNLDEELGFSMARAIEDGALDATLTRDEIVAGAWLGFVAAGWMAGWWAVHQVAIFWMAGGF